MSDYRGFGKPPPITDAWQNEPLPTPESSHPYWPSGLDEFVPGLSHQEDK
jgi:hypothetical protein